MSLPGKQELLKTFEGFLTEAGLSRVTIKNYLSDIRNFLSYCFEAPAGAKPSSVEVVLQNISDYVDSYLEYQRSIFTPVNSVNRRLASIRRFTTFIFTHYHLPDAEIYHNITLGTNKNISGLPTSISNTSHEKGHSAIRKILDQYKSYLVEDKKSRSTVKNYLSDVNHFLTWSAKETPFTPQTLNNVVSEKQLSAYRIFLNLSHTTASLVSRRVSGIKKFAKFCLKENYIDQDPFEVIPEIAPLAPLSWFDRFTAKPKQTPKKRNNRRSPLALLYNGYNSLPISPYINLAILVLASSAMAIFAYNQIIKSAFPAAAALPAAPSRQLSFQGHLTDSGGTPITTATNMEFKLYDASSSGTLLYDSGTCSITPDQNGILNTLIGDSVCGSAIPQSVFAENVNVFLEVGVGAETLTPRQQIATVGFAINSLTLQGYPASASATSNTVPVINASNTMVLGESSPTIQSSSGTFTLTGQSLSFTTEVGSAGNIILQPDTAGAGNVQILTSGSTGDQLRIQNANLTNGTLISGYIGNTSDVPGLLVLSSGSSETEKFAVRADGQTRITTDATLADSALIIDQEGTGSIFTASSSGTPIVTIDSNGLHNSAAYYDSSDSAGTSTYVLTSTGTGTSWVTQASLTGTNLWGEASGALYPKNITDSVNIGSTATSSALVHLAGTNGENSFFNTGNVGIGTNSPSALLDIAGTASSSGTLTFRGSTNPTIDILNGEQLGLRFSPGGDTGLNQLITFENDGDITMTDGQGVQWTDYNAKIIGNSGGVRILATANTDSSTTNGFRINSNSTGGAVNYASSVYATKSVADSNSYNGLYLLTTVSANSGTQSLVRGMLNQLRLTGTATITTAYALHGRVDNTNTGTINDARAAFLDANINSGGGTIDNNYGLYVANQNVGTNNYAIYTNAGSVLFNAGGDANTNFIVRGDTDNQLIYANASTDRVGIGITNPNYKFQVEGNASVSGNLHVIGGYYDSSDSIGTSGYILSSTAYGTQWVPQSSILGGYWQRTSGSIAPLNITDSVNIGSTATSSAYVHLAGTSGENSFFNSGGYLGVGTTSPTAMLTAQGTQSIATLGSELITNGTFDTDLSGWTDSGSNWSYSSATALHTAGDTDTLSQNITVTNGNTYEVEFTLAGISAGSVTISIGSATLANSGTGTTFTTNNTYRRSLVAADTGSVAFTITPSSDFNGSIDTVTVKEVTLNSVPATANLLNSDSSNGLELRSGGSGLNNSYIGLYAGQSNTAGSLNSGFGYGALRTNTAGYSNTAIGSYSMYSNTSGYANSALGYYSLQSNTTGGFNAAVGYSALSHNTTGGTNTAMGYTALTNNTTASANSAFGSYALSSNVTGNSNTSIGYASMLSNTASNNTAVGANTLRGLTSGANNTGIGYNAGFYITGGSTPNTTGGSSVFLGYNTRANADGDTNEIVIGASTTGLGSNTVNLGNDSITTTALKGSVGIGITNPSDVLEIKAGSANEYIALGNLTGSFPTGATSPTHGIGISRTTDGIFTSLLFGEGTSAQSLGIRARSDITFYGNQSPTVTFKELGDVGIGITNPSYTFQVEGNASISGNLHIKGGYYDTSDSIGTDTYVLTSTGYGTSWVPQSSITGAGVWSRSAGAVYPSNITDSVNIGSTATSSALVHLAGTSGENSFINTGNVGIGLTNPAVALDLGGGTNYTNTTGTYQFYSTTAKILQIADSAQSVINLISGIDADNATVGAIAFSRSSGQSDAHRNIAGITATQVNTGTTAGGQLNFWTKPSGAGATSPRMVISSSGRVGIGETSPSSQLQITNTANYIGLIIKGYSSQTNSLQQWLDSSGTILSSVDKYGIPSFHGNTSTSNVFIGTNAGLGIEGGSGNNNVAIGNGSMQNATTSANYNIAIGSNTLTNLDVNGNSNIAIGHNSGQNVSTGYVNSILGYYTAQTLTTGYYNTLYGAYTGNGLTTEHHNTAIGEGAMQSASGSNYLTAVGNAAAASKTGGDFGTYFGFDAGSNSLTGASQVAVGPYAGQYATNNYTVSIGYQTMQGTSTNSADAYGGIGLGAMAGHNIITGTYSVFLGYQSAYNVATSSSSVMVGYRTGYTGAGNNNTFLGASAGYTTTGTANVFLGYNAGYNETGSNKLYIANTNTSTPLIYGDFSSSDLGVNGSLGVGITNPSYTFQVEGNASISGNLHIKGGYYDTSDSIGTDTYVLTSTGYGTSWVPQSSITGAGVWSRSAGAVYPSNITDSVNIGSTATSSALVHLAGTSGENSFFNTGYLGIGTTSPTALLDVAGDATVSGNLTIGYNQTIRPAYGPLVFDYKSSASTWGTAMTIQDTTGNIGIGAGPDSKYKVDVYQAVSDITGAYSTLNGGMYLTITSANTNTASAGRFYTQLQSSTTSDFGGILSGIQTSSYNASAYNTYKILGVSSNIGNTSTGTATEADGFTSGFYSPGSGAITTAKYFTNGGATFTGGVNNLYGLYLSDVTAGSSLNYAIYTNAGAVRFGDTVTATSDLHVTGAYYDTSDSPGSSTYVLTSTGTGTSWVSAGSLSTTNYWGETSGALYPSNITDSVNIGSTATSSALVHLAGTSGENSFVNTGNFGVGTTAPGALLDLANTTQLSNRILLSGQEYYQAGHTSTDGVAIRLGVNRSTNRQLWIADSAAAIDSTHAAFRILTGGNYASIGGVSTDGTANLNIAINSGGGNVGIGTTFNPTYNFQVEGNASISGHLHVVGGYYDSSDSIGSSGYVLSSTATGTSWIPQSAVLGGYWQRTSNSIAPLNITDSVNIGSTATSSAYVHLAGTSGENSFFNTGDVGIGVTSPTLGKLEVAGFIAAHSSANVGFIAQASSDTPWYFGQQLSDSSFRIAQSSIGSGTPAITIDTSNDVGVGTASAGTRLDVVGTGFNQIIARSDTSTDTQAGGIYIKNNINQGIAMEVTDSAESSNPSVGIIYPRDGLSLLELGIGRASPALTVDGSSAYIGIGKTNPGDRLDVAGNIQINAYSIKATRGSDSASGNILKVAQTAGTYSYQNATLLTSIGGSAIQLLPNNASVDGITLLYGGNVGIGITNPSYTFQVEGNASVSGNLHVVGGYYDSSDSIGSSTYVLTSTGTGTSWIPQSSITAGGYWQRTSGSLAPYNITDSVNIGSTATSSALVHLAGTSGEDSFINTGNVGIGVTNPSYAFVVGNTSGSQFISNSTGDTKAATLALGSAGIAPSLYTLYSNSSTSISNSNLVNGYFSTAYSGTLTGNVNDYGTYSVLTISADDSTYNHTSTAVGGAASLANGYTIDNLYGANFSASNYSTALSPDTGFTATLSAAIRGAATTTNGSINNQYGVLGASYIGNGSNVNTSFGVYGLTYPNAAGSTVSTGYGGYFSSQVGADSASITTSRAVYGNSSELSTQSSGGISTGYGGYFNSEDANTAYGIYAQGVQNNTPSETFTNTYGVYGRCQANGANITMTNCYGIYGDVLESAGTITNGYAGYFNSSSALSKSYGVYANVTGASTTNYGVYANVSGASTNYAGIFVGGNVGIGTSTPAAKLNVSDTTKTYNGEQGNFQISNSSDTTKKLYMGLDTALGTNGSGYIQAIKTGTAYLPLLLNPTSGNVGIGITNPNYNFQVEGNASISGHLHVVGGYYDSSDSIGTSGYILSSTATGTSWIPQSAVLGGYWQRTSNSIAPLNITDSVNIGSTATSSALVHLAGTSGENSFINTGNVGIGLTNPAAKLEVDTTNRTVSTKGSLYLATTDSPTIDYGAQLSLGGVWQTGNPSTSFAAVAGRKENGTDGNAAGYLQFATANSSGGSLTEKMRITSTGDVGIGITNPSYNFQVEGNASISGHLHVVGGYYDSSDSIGTSSYVLSSTGTGTQWIAQSALTGLWSESSGAVYPSHITDSVNIGSTATSSAYVHLAGTSGENSFVNTGYFGVGTTSPASPLNVETAAGGESLRISRTGGGTFFNISGPHNTGYNIDFNVYNSTDGTLTAIKMPTQNAYGAGNVYFPSGDVGIGNTSPNATLDVTGTASTSGTLTIGNGSAIQPAYGPLTLNYKSAADTWAAGMTIQDTTGHVGIGTTSPSYLLEISGGNAQINNSGYAALNINSTDSTGAKLGFQNAGSQVGQITMASDTYLDRPGALYIRDSAGSTTDLTLDSSGQLGIGIAPSYKFQVEGNASISGNLHVVGGYYDSSDSIGTSGYVLSTTGSGTSWVDATSLSGTSYWQRTGNSLAPTYITDSVNIGSTATSSAYVHLAGTSGENSFVNTGNFGVGTTNPGFKTTIAKDVTGAGGEQLALIGASNSFLQLRLGYNTSNDYGYLQAIHTGSGYKTLSLNPAGGNVGIGTTSPDALLDVAGDATVSGNLTIDNGYAIQPAYGPLTLNYKSAADTWSTGLNIQDTTGYVTIPNHAAIGGSAGAGSGTILGISETMTDLSGYDIGVRSYVTANPASTSSAQFIGGWFQPNTTTASDITGNFTGVRSYTSFAGTGTLTAAYGVNSTIINTSTGTIQTSNALYASINNSSTGAITNARGLYIGSATGSNLTNVTGLYIADQSTGSNTNYAIYTNAGVNLFNAANDTSSDFVIRGGTDNNLFHTDASTDMIGIGTSTPGGKVDIYTSNTVNGLRIFDTTNSNRQLYGLASSSNNAQLSMFDATPTEQVRLDTAGDSWLTGGNLGIGLTNPAGLLDIAGTNGDVIVDATGNSISMTRPAANYLYASDASGSLYLGAGGVQDVVSIRNTGAASGILNVYNGNVGIGITNPSYTLQVEGTASVSGNLAGINGVPYTWPGSQGSANSILLNNGSGTLSWASSSGTGIVGYWQRVSGSLTPTNITDTLNLGASATSSAYIHLASLSSDDTFITNSSSGSVGIGVTNPSAASESAKLMVAGNIMPDDSASAYDLGSLYYNWSRLYLSDGLANNTTGTLVLDPNNQILRNDTWYVGSDLSDPALITFDTNSISASQGAITVGASGSGKINVGTIDPPYTINGQKFATYQPSMIGVKEEVTGTIATSEYVDGVGYRFVLDPLHQPQDSDLWVFSKTTDLKDNLDQLTVLLTAQSQAKVWYEVDNQNNIIAFYSSSPTKISYRMTAPRFDALSWPTKTPDRKIAGFVINDPDTPIDPSNIILPDYTAQLVKQSDNLYLLYANNKQVSEVASFFKAIVANFKAGYAQVSNLVADNLTVNQKLISPQADINTLNSQNLTTKDATVSGTLYANNIHSSTVDSLTNQLDVLSGQYSTASALLADLQAKYSTFDSLSSTQTSTNSSSILTTDTASTSALPADVAFNSVSTVNLIAGNVQVTDTLLANSLNSNNTDLYIQPDNSHAVHFLADIMTIYPNGHVVINGDLLLKGTLFAQAVDTKDATISGQLKLGNPTATPSADQLIALYGQDGGLVSSVNSSGSADFQKVATNELVIAAANNASNSAVASSSAQTNSNATIGTAVIPARQTEVTISAAKIDNNTLVYLTPVSDTRNQVLYVKSKEPGVGFTVAISTPVDQDIQFNYWLVKTK